MTQQRSTYPLDYTAEKDRHPEGAMDRVKDAAGEVQDYAGKLAEQGRKYCEKAQEAARNFKPYVEKSMKEQPMATVAMASVVGFVLGALWKK